MENTILKKELSIVMPTFNEGKNIKQTLQILIKLLEEERIDYEIIIIDKNSLDETLMIIETFIKQNKKIKCFPQKSNGFGGALVEGSKKCEKDLIVWVMADLSDDPSTIKKMLIKMEEGFDLVVGSRNIPGGSRGDQLKIKAFNSWLYSQIAKRLFKFKINEITNAFRIFKKEVFLSLELKRDDFAISPEFSIKAHLKKYKLGEVPTIYNERKGGESKMNLTKMGLIYYYLLITHLLLKIFS